MINALQTDAKVKNEKIGKLEEELRKLKRGDKKENQQQKTNAMKLNVGEIMHDNVPTKTRKPLSSLDTFRNIGMNIVK